MDPHALGSLRAASVVVRFPPQSNLFHEGESPEFLHLLLEGTVELYSEHNGQALGFSIQRPSSAFILAAVLLDAPYLNSACTLERSDLLLIPAQPFRTAIENERALARAVETETALAYRGMMRELKNHKFRPAVERLANWLLRHMDQNGCEGTVNIPFSKRKLASHIGTTPENLSRLFAELTAVGVCARSAQQIFIENTAALAAFARPDPLIDGTN